MFDSHQLNRTAKGRANVQKALAKTVVEKAKDPETVKAAEAMVQKLEDGEMLTTAEAETLAGALEAATQAEGTAETVQQEEAAPAEKKPLTPVEAIVRVAQGKVGNEKEKLNIDNTANRNYTGNNNANGGMQNVSRRSLEADSDGISGVYDSGDAGYQGRSGLGGSSVASGFVLSEQAQDAIQSRGVDVVEAKDVSANSAAFSAALDESRAANTQNGWAVTPKSAQEIAENGVRVFMNDSASAGFGIAPDGDIEAVFANKSKGAPRHALASMMPQTIANGGTKLDCYGEKLVSTY